MTRNLEGGRLTGFVLVSVIESALDVVDRVLAGIPNPVPSAGQLRQVRGQALRTAASPVRRVRRPLLAVIGTVDLLADQTRGLDLGIDLPAGLRANAEELVASKLVTSKEWLSVDRFEVIRIRTRNDLAG